MYVKPVVGPLLKINHSYIGTSGPATFSARRRRGPHQIVARVSSPVLENSTIVRDIHLGTLHALYY